MGNIYVGEFKQVDECLEKIRNLSNYDPIMDVVKDRFLVEITHHLTSLKADKQNSPNELIRLSLQNTQQNGCYNDSLKDAYQNLGKEHAVTCFLCDMADRLLDFDGIMMLAELLFGKLGLRQQNTETFNVKGEQLQPASVSSIELELKELVRWFNKQMRIEKMHPIARTVIFHHKFTVIRPFADWNGRIARLLLNVALMNQGYLPILISSDDRLLYYECLNKADNGNLYPLASFIASKELSTINDFMNSPEYLSIQGKFDLEQQVERIGGREKCFVLTEDSATDNLIGYILQASGFNMDETNIISYSGCSKIGSANLFSIFVKEKMPEVKVIVHRDRDYLTDEEIEIQRDSFRRIDTHLFVTKGTDIESHFLNAKHLTYCCPKLGEAQSKRLISRAIGEVYPQSVDYLRKKEFGGMRSEKYTHLNKAIEDLVKNDPMRFTHGKTTLRVLEAMIRSTLQEKIKIECSSPYLMVPELKEIADQIWKK